MAVIDRCSIPALMSVTANTNANFVNCTAATSAGMLTLPSSLPRALSGQAVISLVTENTTRVTSANASVALSATKSELSEYTTFQ